MASISPRYNCIKDVCLVAGYVGAFVLCDDNGEFMTVVSVDKNENVSILTTELDGTPYVPVGTIETCNSGLTRDVEIRMFCDDNAGVITPYLIAYEYDEDGNIIGTTITLIDGVTPYVPTGITRVCAGEDGDVENVVLCDDDTQFLRSMIYDNTGAFLGSNDTELDGTTPYVVSGTVSLCSDDGLAEVSLDPVNLIPSGTLNDERLQVTAVVTTSSIVLDADTTHIKWRHEGGAVRLTTDNSAPVGGVDPSTANGVPIVNKDSDIWTIEEWNAAKWIRSTGVDGWIHASQYKPKGS